MRSAECKIVGVIPAAGLATRLSPLPMSKELYPVGFRPNDDGVPYPKAATEYLLDRLRVGGVREAYIVLRPGKWDIPAYLGDGSISGIHLAYLTVHVPFGVPFTLDQAFPFVGDYCVALGFPDILFWPENAFAALFHRLRNSTADAVLGLFPTVEPDRVGVVDVDNAGGVRGIFEKSGRKDLPYMWAIAVWKPSFHSFCIATSRANRVCPSSRSMS
jgi:glucose-1-phosphate thymidylyltransferase